MALYSFEAADITSKRDAVEYIRQAPMIVEAFDMIGPKFLATLAGASAQEVQQLTNEITDELKIKMTMNLGDRAMRAPLLHLGELDWRILERLRYDALCPTKEIADSLSITPRMVQYRISKLLGSGALFIRAAMNTQEQQGLIFYGLIVFVDQAKQSLVVRKIRETYGEKLWSLSTPMPNIILPNMFGFTTREPEEAVINTSELDGVHRCSLSIFKEIVEPERPNWIDMLIAEMITGRGSRRR